MKNKIKFKKAINLALSNAMKKDKDVLIMGLGVGDPKNIFSTTSGLKEKFGNKRVFDVPCSENALTGIAIGYGINKKAVLTHQRFDFVTLSFDQLINNAAKLHYMYGGKLSTNITIRIIIGKGWGQGPTHSQNLQSLLAHIPGLKIYFPFNSNDVYNILFNSIFDPNPVLILEHRWLYELEGNVKFSKRISYCQKISKGNAATIVSMGNTVLDAIEIKNVFMKKKILFDIFKIISINPLKINNIISSVKKTKILLEPSNKQVSISSEIISILKIKKIDFESIVVSNPFMPTPTSYFLTRNHYPNLNETIKTIIKFLKLKVKISKIYSKKFIHDVPNKHFKGPF
jgi:pyruvate dehydrogenase E1 component beta subunit